MKNLFKAIAAFQQEVPVIHKETEGYGYSYADLPTILEVINPLLKKHGLGFAQPIDGNSVRTIIFHIESGEAIDTKAEIPQAELKGMNAFQTMGSAITYLRRYALSSALGLVTEKDNDGHGEQVKSKPAASQPNKQFDKDDLPYLNKTKYKSEELTTEWTKAVEYVQNGGSIDSIRKKYKMTTATLKDLQQYQPVPA